MIRLRTLVLALVLALGALSIPQAASAAEPFSKAVGKPLQAANEAIKARQWDTALARLKEAQAVPGKKPHEQFTIDQMLGYVLYTQKNYAEAAPVYERLIESGRMPPAAVQERTKAVATMYFNLKNYPKTIEWTQKALQNNPSQQDMQQMLGQAYFLGGNYRNASDSMMKLVAASERAGQAPKEEWLRVVQNSQMKLDVPKKQTVPTLEKLVRYYRKPEDWQALLSNYDIGQNGDRVKLGFYQLMLDVNALKRPVDYIEAAQLSMDHVPALGRSLMDKGMENGALKTTNKSEEARYQRTIDGLDKLIPANKAQLEKLAATAPGSRQGNEDVLLGRMYMSYGQYDQAIAALERGLKKPGVADPDEARVALGVAYLRKGQKEPAAQAFRSVKKNSPWSGLASLWMLRV